MSRTMHITKVSKVQVSHPLFAMACHLMMQLKPSPKENSITTSFHHWMYLSKKVCSFHFPIADCIYSDVCLGWVLWVRYKHWCTPGGRSPCNGAGTTSDWVARHRNGSGPCQQRILAHLFLQVSGHLLWAALPRLDKETRPTGGTGNNTP